ncbi:MAG: hypothetical protein ABW023_06550 [Sphingomonas sp.]
MSHLLPLLAALCLACPTHAQERAEPASSQTRSLPWRALLEWQPADGTRVYANGDTRLVIAPRACDGDGVPACVEKQRTEVPVVTVTAPGMQPFTMTGALGTTYRFGMGRIETGSARRAIILETFTGGAHCCSVIDVAVPEGDTYRIVRLRRKLPDGNSSDMFDATLEEFPIDLSGDGAADFVLYDDAFLYRFASYAGSVAPPLILNVRDGRSIDVSRDPAFAPLFLIDMAKAREACINPEEAGWERNGACAGYVADAARVGQFDAAWKIMLQHYGSGEPHSGKDFPGDLRDFLRKNGYIH